MTICVWGAGVYPIVLPCMAISMNVCVWGAGVDSIVHPCEAISMSVCVSGAGVDPLLHGGGSGHVLAKNPVSPLRAIQEAVGAPITVGPRIYTPTRCARPYSV